MSIALAALIIALASLLWNVVSTAYSWKFSKPAIRIAARQGFHRGRYYLTVDVQNRGGSAIAITQLAVIYSLGKWWRRFYFPRRKIWLQRKGPWSARIITPTPEETEYGPRLPYTIQAYHSQKWEFDRSRLYKEWLKTPEHTNKLIIEVLLSTGKRAGKKIDAEVIPGEAAIIIAKNEAGQLELPFEMPVEQILCGRNAP
jgi:hypothetical protein